MSHIQRTTGIETPQIVHTEALSYAFVHLLIPRSQMHAQLRPALQEVHDAVTAQGLPIRPWFAHHLELNDSTFNFAVCLPVPSTFTPTARVSLDTWPASTVARTTYRGNYPGLPAAWQELHNWIRENGHAPAADIYERYVDNVGNTADPNQYLTELSWPLLDQPEPRPS